MNPDLSFPDLRAFLDHLRRDDDLAVVDAELDPRLEVAEIHRRVIAAGGPALLFTHVRGAAFPLVTNLFGTAPRVELAFGTRPLRLIERMVDLAETLLPPTPAEAVGRAGRRPRGPADRALDARGAGPVTRGRDERRAARSAAGAHVLARGRRPVRHAAARLHRASDDRAVTTSACTACRSTTRARPACTGRSARAAASTTRWPRRAGEALPVTVFLGGPPALILAAIAPLPENVPELMLASLDRWAGSSRWRRTRGRSAARLVASAEFALVGDVSAARARRRRVRSAITTATTRCSTTTRSSAVDALCRRRDAIYPGDGRRQAAAGGLLHRRPPAGAARAAVPAGDAGGRRSVVLRRDRLSLAGGRGREGALQARGDGVRLPHPRRRAAVADQVPAGDGPARGPARFPRHARARAGAHRSRRPTSTSSRTCRWTRSTTRGRRSTRARRACWLGLGEPVRELPREFRPERRPRPRSPTCASSAAAAWWSAGPRRRRTRGARRGLAAHPAFRDWPLLVLTDEPQRAAASPMNFLWTTFTRFEPARRHPCGRTRVVRHHVVHEPPILIDARMKPSFPRELVCDPDTAALVSRRWKEYFPARRSGDGRLGKGPPHVVILTSFGRVDDRGPRCARSGRRLDSLLGRSSWDRVRQCGSSRPCACASRGRPSPACS